MNDPRVTQYALGELTGSDRDKFERELAASETLQRDLNETIKLAEALGTLTMPTDILPEEKRDALRQQCADNLAKKTTKFPLWRILVDVGAVAAVIAILASLSLPAITGSLSKGDPARMVKMKSAREAQRIPLAENERMQIPMPATATAPSVAEASSSSAQQPSDAEFKKHVDEQIPASTSSGLAAAGAGPSAPAATFASRLDTGNDLMMSQAVTTEDAASIQPFSAPVASAPMAGTGSRSSASFGMVAERGGEARKAEMLGDVPLQGRLFTDTDDNSLRKRAEHNTEAYAAIQENVFLPALDNPLSTFSIDVDTASYANVRRFLQNDQLPPAGAIRTEELLNYFTYAYPQPEGNVPFSVNLEVSQAPWDAKRELVRIGLKGRDIPAAERSPANLVFLLDVSGSMDQPDKLPLLQRSLSALVENLSPRDRVAIVVYAGSSGVVLPSTPGTEKSRILAALENLKAGGSTNGGSGIKLAYNIAREHFLKEGNNRVILCTDGDFNVGTTNESQLVRLIEKERASGVFLSVLGFGTGNLKDSTMEKLADKGNGNYAYIDSLTEGRKVLVEQMGATLFTIAKDVKIQVEFNPARVAGYRLIGYENRLLAKEDFNDDKKDAGEIGAGHTVTALYEIIPAGQPLPDRPSVDPLKYQPVPAASENPQPTEGRQTAARQPEGEAKPNQSAVRDPQSSDLLTVKLRYKAPNGDTSKLIEVPLNAQEIPAFAQSTSDFQFAAAVAAFGMKLRGSPTAGDIGWPDIQRIVRAHLGNDAGSYRAEFLTLLERAARLQPAGRPPGE